MYFGYTPNITLGQHKHTLGIKAIISHSHRAIFLYTEPFEFATTLMKELLPFIIGQLFETREQYWY